FTALHNLRVDRSSTTRDLASERQLSEPSGLLKATRAADMPALKAGLESLQATDFPEKDAAISSLSAAVKRLGELHSETTSAMAQPKASRPAGLAKTYFDTTTSLMGLLDKISSQL